MNNAERAGLLRGMKRGLACAVVLLCAACQRHPLDLRVRAETPQEFHEWHARVMSRQRADIAEEFTESVARIVECSPHKMSLADPRMMHSREHPICRELDGRTVRDVMIAGYAAANETLLREIILESDSFVATLQHAELITQATKDATRVDRMVKRRSSVLDAAKAQVEANRRRIAELKEHTPRQTDFFVRFAQWRVLTFILP